MSERLDELRFRLEYERKRLNVPFHVLEQDYLLSWILVGISLTPVLKESLAFKGGTALKKCFFGEYRFSEDLDFTFIEGGVIQDSLEQLLNQACSKTSEIMEEYIPNPRIMIQKYVEKQPHPDGQLAFIIKGQLPWHREPVVKAMVEITTSENIILPLVTKNIIHNYGETINATLNVYSLEEIIAEKLRAILQYTKKLHEHSWARSRARDYYDLWNIFNYFDSNINYSVIKNVLEKKCIGKNISFDNIDDFFQPITLSEVNKTWEQWLKQLVIKLPEVDEVINSVKSKLESIL